MSLEIGVTLTKVETQSGTAVTGLVMFTATILFRLLGTRVAYTHAFMINVKIVKMLYLLCLILKKKNSFVFVFGKVRLAFLLL